MSDSRRGDDATLVRRMLHGEDAAFDAFFEDHFPRLYRFAWSRTGRPADARRSYRPP
jgi:DNA-directed RNA polymerase specialized sigma24 family protein